uniref:Ig-like domain-containing protein n=1 Tax=Neogobius melanostomus TaxID=47308 RepID=A0A8C6V5W4_9GOBI
MAHSTFFKYSNFPKKQGGVNVVYFEFLWKTSLTVLSSVAEAEVSEGQDCELPCSGHKEVRVSVLEWTRFDQRRDLLVFRAGKVLNGYEDPDFTNRVQLLDPQLQRGDLSVMLKDVTFKDTGTYECLVLYADKQEISQFIRPGTGGVITIVIVLIVLIGLCLSIGFILYLKRSKLSQVPSRESDLEKSISNGSSTSSSTTSANLSNGHKASYQSPPSNSQGDPLTPERTVPPTAPPCLPLRELPPSRGGGVCGTVQGLTFTDSSRL